jgi:FixJ family two-component response regulator
MVQYLNIPIEQCPCSPGAKSYLKLIASVWTENATRRSIGESTRVNNRSQVIVIDDDLRIRESLQGLFEAADLFACFFSSAEDFLRRQDLDEIACLICDVKMPGMSGYDLYRQIAKTHPHIPTVFITAYPEDSRAADIMRSEAVTLMEKPFEGEELVNWVLMALRRAT